MPVRPGSRYCRGSLAYRCAGTSSSCPSAWAVDAWGAVDAYSMVVLVTGERESEFGLRAVDSDAEPERARGGIATGVDMLLLVPPFGLVGWVSERGCECVDKQKSWSRRGR